MNAPFWELGQNLKFVATDLLLAKEAVIEGNILASSMSYKYHKRKNYVRTEDEIINGSVIRADGNYTLPTLRNEEIREIHFFPIIYQYHIIELSPKPASVKLPDADQGFIVLFDSDGIRLSRTVRELSLSTEKHFLTFLGVGRPDGTHWAVFARKGYKDPKLPDIRND